MVHETLQSGTSKNWKRKYSAICLSLEIQGDYFPCMQPDLEMEAASVGQHRCLCTGGTRSPESVKCWGGLCHTGHLS